MDVHHGCRRASIPSQAKSFGFWSIQLDPSKAAWWVFCTTGVGAPPNRGDATPWGRKTRRTCFKSWMSKYIVGSFFPTHLQFIIVLDVVYSKFYVNICYGFVQLLFFFHFIIIDVPNLVLMGWWTKCAYPTAVLLNNCLRWKLPLRRRGDQPKRPISHGTTHS